MAPRGTSSDFGDGGSGDAANYGGRGLGGGEGEGRGAKLDVPQEVNRGGRVVDVQVEVDVDMVLIHKQEEGVEIS